MLETELNFTTRKSKFEDFEVNITVKTNASWFLSQHGSTQLEKLKRNTVGRNPVSQNVPSLETNNQPKAAACDDIDESRSLPKRMVGVSHVQNFSLYLTYPALQFFTFQPQKLRII